jgi:predicted PurR-regulated permease PerM
MPSERPPPRFFLLLIAAAGVLLALVASPIIHGLVLAAVLVGAVWRVQQLLSRHVRGRRAVAAALLLAAVVVLLLGPIATIAAFVVRDGSDDLRFVSEAARSSDVAALVDRLPDATRVVVRDAITRLPRDLGELLGQLDLHRDTAAAAVDAAVAATGSLAFLLVVGLVDNLVNTPDDARVAPVPGLPTPDGR